MDEELIRKIFRNKANNQCSITLPKKLFDKTRNKSTKIKIKDWEFFE